MQNTKGVSLERIDYNGSSTQNNFHSAATSSGYATPGFKNSQYKIDEEVMGEIKIVPEIFSPDNDGHEDFATINYNFPSPGYVANVTIFDASGRPVRSLQKNALSGIKGYYRWDGLDDKNKKLPEGIYIIYTEIFNKEGKKKLFKNTIVLARKNY
jgi:flagellar hook assembly protein FlgD